MKKKFLLLIVCLIMLQPIVHAQKPGAFLAEEFKLNANWLLEGKVGLGFRYIIMNYNFDPKGKYRKNSDF